MAGMFDPEKKRAFVDYSPTSIDFLLFLLILVGISLINNNLIEGIAFIAIAIYLFIRQSATMYKVLAVGFSIGDFVIYFINMPAIMQVVSYIGIVVVVWIVARMITKE